MWRNVKRVVRSENFIGIALIFMVSGLVYLILVPQFGYYYDDWYLMYSAGAKGVNVFWDIFAIDRPLRSLVMIPAYWLFGQNPLYYNISAYLFRAFGALALFWLLNMLWRHRRVETTIMALLFLIYPGFLSQPNAIDYQSHIVGLAAAFLSVALTIKAILSERRMEKIIFHALSILLGCLYLSQMEWYIGFEFFRWAGVFLISARQGGGFLQKGTRAIRWAYPSLAAPFLFLTWRLFFFESGRGATDVGVQFEQVRLYPFQTMYSWMVRVIQDLMDVTLSAWVIPLSQLTGYIQRWGGALAVIVAGLVILGLHLLKQNEPIGEPASFAPSREALMIGLLTAVGGLIPIAMVNREVAFPSFSRYALVSSVGVAILIAAILMRLNGNLLRNGIIAVLCVISTLTHHANSVKHAQETSITRMFWWQVSWRVPEFEQNTTLIANYPAGFIEEDYVIWGPANLIYYPESQNPEYVQPGLYASILNRDTVIKVLTRERQKYDNRRGIITYPNHRNILVLTQPTLNSCLHVMDGARPEYSRSEGDMILTIGPYSEIEHVLVDESPHTPPTIVFGPEPERGWCYYYQKADLARQRGDWNDVIKIGKDASDKGLTPKDLIEWMPFLQAYALAGDVDPLKELAPAIRADPYIFPQTCRIISSMQGLSAEVIETVDSLYCTE